MLRVAAFNLGQGKDEYCTDYGPVPNRVPVISMSTRFHDKTVETADNPVYNILFVFFVLFFVFSFFFVNRFWSMFQHYKRVSTQQYQVGTVCAAGFFSKRPP